MKNIISTFLVLISAATLYFTSCSSLADREIYSRSEQSYVDSIVYAHRNIDSLEVIAVRFAEEDSRLGLVTVYRELGRAYRNASRYQEAIDTHMKGLEVAREIRDTLQIVQALNNIGTAYRRMGVLEEAASWHYKGLALCEQWSDMSKVGLKNRVVSLNGLGNVHLSMGNDSLAMSSFREALKGETQLGSHNGMAINYANIGALFEGWSQIDSARYYYGLSLECNRITGSSLGISLCYGHFGRLAEREGDLKAAYGEYKSAYDILSASSDKWHWLESCTSLARVSMKLGHVAAARRYLSESLAVAEELDSATHLVDIYNLYYQMDAKDGRFKDSLKWLEKYTDCMSRVSAERNEKAIFELRTKYEREKNQNEMNLLQAAHSQKEKRDRMKLICAIIILALAIMAIMFLVYSLRMRSRNNRILRELDQTKNNYFTNIAHEFRTPLTIILSAARNIRKHAPDEETSADATDVITHSEGLLELVNQVLCIARMTSRIAPDPVWRRGNLSAFVHGIYERSLRLASEHDISLEYVSDEDVEMDFVPDFIIHVVQNLLSNAIKFSRAGGKVVMRLDRTVSSGRDVVRICVKDWGLGITEEQMSHLWEPFYQTSSSHSLLGTGIGLSLVKLSVEAMNGTVSATSDPESGTEFVVEIPVLRQVDDDRPALEQYVETGSPDTEDADPEKFCILIVEDNRDVARWQMRQLEGNYRFVFAENGMEGLHKAEEHVPDLIITDVMMPLMDGFEMCRRMRESELLCHIPIVMVTARATNEDRIKGLEAGADAYLQKPYDENELDLRVRKLLQQRMMLKKRFAGDMETASSSETESPSSAVDRMFLEKFDSALEAAFVSGKVDCEDLAAEMCIGRAQLNRKIKAITGYRTTEYILLARLSKAKELLRTTGLPVGEISMQCGIEDVGYFSTLFRKHVGMTPSAYRNS